MINLRVHAMPTMHQITSVLINFCVSIYSWVIQVIKEDMMLFSIRV